MMDDDLPQEPPREVRRLCADGLLAAYGLKVADVNTAHVSRVHVLLDRPVIKAGDKLKREAELAIIRQEQERQRLAKARGVEEMTRVRMDHVRERRAAIVEHLEGVTEDKCRGVRQLVTEVTALGHRATRSIITRDLKALYNAGLIAGAVDPNYCGAWRVWGKS